MKTKIIFIGIIAVLVAVIAFLIIPKTRDNSVKNSTAETDKKNRYITVVNDTGAVINELYISLDDGTEVEKTKITDHDKLDQKSISIKIPKEYDEYDTFKVFLIDRYKKRYEKTASDVKLNDRTVVSVTEDDYVEQKGDWLNNIFGFFNGD